MNQLIRNIQIDLIMDNPNPIIDIFNGIWNDLRVIETTVYHNNGGEIVYINSNNEWVFYQNDDTDSFLCNYYRFWIFFEIKLGLPYNETQSIIKVLIEDKLSVGKNVSIKSPLSSEYYSGVDDMLSKIVIPLT